jgi:hypothetical protein
MKVNNAYQYPNIIFRRLGYGSMLFLLLLALIFYQERAFLLDIAFQTFLMINEGTVQVMVNRFGSAIIQILPLMAIKAGAPIEVISLLYSASFPILYLAIYTLIVRVFKNDYLGWALVFLFTLIVYDAFYWATSEQQQGLAVLLLFYAYALRYSDFDRWWMWIINLVSILILAYYHPLIFIPFYFLWFFFLLHDPQKFINRPFLALGIMMIAVLFIKSQLSVNWYDSGKIDTFKANLIKYYPNYLDLKSHAKFLSNCIKIWYLFPFFFALDSLFYIIKKRWWKVILLWSFCFGYIMLLHIASPNSTYRFYAEVNYMALSIFVMIPFLFDIAPLIKPQRLLLLFTILMVLRLGSIAWHHQPFRDRIDWIETQLNQQAANESKFYLSKSDAPMDTLLMEWGLPYESLLISSRRGESKTLFIHHNTSAYAEPFKKDSLFITSFKQYNLDELNPAYFKLPEGTYQPLK